MHGGSVSAVNGAGEVTVGFTMARTIGARTHQPSPGSDLIMIAAGRNA
jgi:hypothetical protein